MKDEFDDIFINEIGDMLGQLMEEANSAWSLASNIRDRIYACDGIPQEVKDRISDDVCDIVHGVYDEDSDGAVTIGQKYVILDMQDDLRKCMKESCRR